MTQNYTPEFRKKIVRLHEEEGRTYKSITAEYGVSKASICKWCSELRKECQTSEQAKANYDSMKENLRLKRENEEGYIMPIIPYINYKELDEFYTIPQLCNLLNLSKPELREKCEQYGVKPRRNEIGDYGLVKYDVRKLHNSLYYEGRDNEKKVQKEDDPWA